MSGKGKMIWYEKALVQSKAFRSLNSTTAHAVLAEFYCKRQCEKVGRSGKKQWNIRNNGEIEFIYDEAIEKLGITGQTFTRAIDELRNKGFIDITATGAGVHKVKNLYAISNRWRNYGTPEYDPPKPRPKGPINRGFQKGNKHGRNCKKRKS